METRKVGKAIELSLVIPVYNERDNLSKSIPEINRYGVQEGNNYEIILIDDGSVDDSWRKIQELTDRYANIRALRLSRNYGKEAAICAGMEAARGRAVIIMDGDLQHPPSLIPEMMQRWRKKEADVIEGVKQRRGKEPLLQKIGAKLFYSIFKVLTGYDLHRASDYKLMDRKVVDAWLRIKEFNTFFRGINVWLGFKRIEIPFSVSERIGGRSGWSTLSLIRLAVNALTAFSAAPLRVVSFMGLLFGVFAFVLGVQTLYNKIIGNAVSGFTTVILLLLIVGCVLMFALGIIGEYLARIYDEVKKRPRYIIEEEIGNEHKIKA